MSKQVRIQTAGRGRERSSLSIEQYAAEALPDQLTELEAASPESMDLPDLLALFRQAHESALIHQGEALRAALVAGKVLLVVRDRLQASKEAGGFRGWCEQAGIARRTAYEYIDIATHPEVCAPRRTLREAREMVREIRRQNSPETPAIAPTFRRLPPVRIESALADKLEAIAQIKGVESAQLLTEVIEAWLRRQKLPVELDVQTLHHE